ncbi:MAG TPA: ThiF family adenylyltransferase [Ideonella sp.]|uniref:ThiF family adenylyltransferase n=1 Tax=Ideonella sp. TaxID=1929293 RepID=UPI002BD90CC9|nr:ThiF family adenylyltransferase [Ideonella sp.]HSI49186.1 ThiF family adenylyltransferase [Ideonella sp.]
MKQSPFETAGARVEEWLDRGSGSVWAKRDKHLRVEQGMAWEVDLQDDTLPVHSLRIVLPPDFPASTCDLFVDRSYFLRLPHVEADGHVCLGLQSIPNDYDDPVAAVVRALGTLKDQLLEPSVDKSWVEHQFQTERASYWAQRCIARRKAGDRRPVPLHTYVDVRELDRWAMGSLAAYVPSGAKQRLFSLQVAAEQAVDPNDTAIRHRWADGTMVRGNALFVRMPPDEPWTPSTWPNSFGALDALVGRLTDNESSVASWLQRTGWADDPQPHSRKNKKKRRREAEAPPGQRPLLVVLVQDGVMYGYQLFGSATPRLTLPSIEPVDITRVDPDWALARDHQLDVLRARRQKRVLFVGAGSLGSPLARALVRAGLGTIDIVDAQLMGPENTSRHELGAEEVGQGKAPALAGRLMRDVPGITAKGYIAEAAVWMTQHCKPGVYDLVVDCTAESSVRAFIAHTRSGLLGECPVIHAWTEPLCSAGHVVLSQPDVPWPAEDQADELVNASDLSAGDTRIQLPACSAGFHPYGAADIELVAAFAAERVIALLDDLSQRSMVWSCVRSSAYFQSLPVPVATRAIVPTSTSKFDSIMTSRDLAGILGRA